MKKTRWSEADCILKFDVPRSIYKVGDKGLILIDVLDFNKHDVELVSGNQTEIFASGNSATARSLSAVPLQASCFILLFDFYFEVVDHLNEPEFIDPTPPNSQHYEIYSGAAFTVDIYAKPTDNSSTTEIDQFLLTRRDGIHVYKSIVTKRPDLGSRVQSITLKWTPKQNEVGKHLVCSYVIDTLGYD
ncbi:Hypothetical predicted protein [Mytilus galloprovincialis]|uniref:Uncharacterized protein n=1 Tax=Mytilus galloprovincialis TaxID=29158 RepID=A0A8B6E9D0_MYTGA|nr:Hypothetical predicted protein [Mytilus galloprovincialis]